MKRKSVVAMAALGAGLMLGVPPAAAQDWGRPEGYNDRRGDVGTVSYNGGRFVFEGRGRWVEYGVGQQIKATFEELSRTRDWIDLNDPSRDIQIRLNLRARMILITERGGPYRPLYPMQSFSDQRPGDWDYGNRPPGGWNNGPREPNNIDREIEAGQWLVNQFDAQRVCPNIASRAGGIWTGQFRTVRPAVMSVCTVRVR